MPSFPVLNTSEFLFLQSARSGSLLLTAANLAQIANEQSITGEQLSNRDQNIKYYLEHTDHNDLLSLPNRDFNKKIDPDSVSIASSMHFTVVNVNARPPVKPRSFCRKHQLTILVVTMSVLFTIGILCAIVFLEGKFDMITMILQIFYFLFSYSEGKKAEMAALIH